MFAPITNIIDPTNIPINPSESLGFGTVIMGSKVYALSDLWVQQTAVWVDAATTGCTTPTLFVECLGDVNTYDIHRGWKAEWRTRSEYANNEKIPNSLLDPEPPLVIAGIMNYTSTTTKGLVIATIRGGDIGVHSLVPEIIIKDYSATSTSIKTYQTNLSDIPISTLKQRYNLNNLPKLDIGMLCQEARTIDFAFFIQPLSSLFISLPELGSNRSTNTIQFDRYEALRTNPHLYGKDSIFMKKVSTSTNNLVNVINQFMDNISTKSFSSSTLQNYRRPLTVNQIDDTSLAAHVTSLFNDYDEPVNEFNRSILEEERLLREAKKDTNTSSSIPDNLYIPITRSTHNQFVDTIDELLVSINALTDLEINNTHVWHYVRQAGIHLEYRDFYPDLRSYKSFTISYK